MRPSISAGSFHDGATINRLPISVGSKPSFHFSIQSWSGMEERKTERSSLDLPALANFYEEAQENVTSQELLNIQPSRRTYLLESLSSAADHYCPMRLSLDINQAIDLRRAARIFPTFGNDRGHVRKLIAGHLKY